MWSSRCVVIRLKFFFHLRVTQGYNKTWYIHTLYKSALMILLAYNSKHTATGNKTDYFNLRVTEGKALRNLLKSPPSGKKVWIVIVHSTPPEILQVDGRWYLPWKYKQGEKISKIFQAEVQWPPNVEMQNRFRSEKRKSKDGKQAVSKDCTGNDKMTTLTCNTEKIRTCSQPTNINIRTQMQETIIQSI